MLPFTSKPSRGDYDNSKARRIPSCWRVWRRLSRLQRKVVTVILVISALGSIVVFRHFVPDVSDQAKGELDSNLRNNDNGKGWLGLGGEEGHDPVNDDFNPGVGGDDIEQDKTLKGRPGKRGPPKGLGGKLPIREQDREHGDPLEVNQPIGDEDRDNGDRERVLPHLGIQVPPGVVKEGVRNKEDEVYIAENDDDDDHDDDEYDIDHSDVGAAAGAPGVNQIVQKVLVCNSGSL